MGNVDELELLRAVNAQPFPIARSWTLFACENALPVWEALCAEIDFVYRDSIVGLKHEIDPGLLRRTLAAIAEESTTADLSKEWLEPITALQDDDWWLPAPARLAFHAFYNALEGETTKDAKRFAKSIVQSRNALSAFYEGDASRFDAIWSAWWARSSSLVHKPVR